MRLTDVDELTEKCGEWYTEEGTEEGFIGTLKGLLDAAPTIDAIPVGWLREWQDEVGTLNEWWPIIERIITVWHEEQEAR